MRIENNTLIKYLSAATAILLSVQVNAITINDVAGGVTAAQMETVLTGTGVTVTNLTITNVANCNENQAIGIFTNGAVGGAGPVLGEPTGVVIASGQIAAGNLLSSSNNVANVTNVICTATASDADMVALEAGTANGEYTAIEFDVVPQYAMMAVPFQFGSDEFPEYVCSNFNDVTGIFVSGPGISGPFSGGLQAENYAKTVTGDLSSINWVNTGVVGVNGNIADCQSLLNAAYFTDNSNGNNTGGNATVATTNTNLEMDGFTNKLFQPITVVPGQTYHVKIAVADSFDRQFDSATFIHPVFSSDTFNGFDYGDAPDGYKTLTANGGANHGISTSIFMGAAAPDAEINGLPSINADGDDTSSSDDEDGVSSFPALTTSATSYSLNVTVTNNTGSVARLVGWIDFNLNGTFDSSEAAEVVVADGITGGTAVLNWVGLSVLSPGDSYLRLRLSSDVALSTSTPASAMSDGEVEDYPLAILGPNFDKYVSTNASCADTLDTINVNVATNVYYCYVVSNPNSITFTVNPGATSDSLGHDLSALEQVYATGASQTVIVGPILAGSAQLPAGATTNNTAQLTASYAGPIDVLDSEAASVTVNPAAPASGVKQLYFDSLTAAGGNLTRAAPAVATNTGGGGIANLTVTQGIVFQAPYTITGPSTANVQLRLRRRTTGGSRTVQATLRHGLSGIVIGAPASVNFNTGAITTITIPIAIASDEAFPVNDFVRVDLSTLGTGNIQVYSLNGGVRSEVQLQSSTVINVDSIAVFAAPLPATTQFTSYKPGSAVSIRATVSDPFGFADINATGTTLSMTDSNPGVVLLNQAMTSEPAPSGAIRIFEYLYNIPAAPAPDGVWSISATANEGTEGTIFHTQVGSMIVGDANVTLLKSSAVISDPVNVSNPKAIPGAVIEYTVTATNSGFGYGDDDTLVITDPISTRSEYFTGTVANPLQFSPNDSDLTYTFVSLNSATDDIDFSNDNGITWTYYHDGNLSNIDVDGFDDAITNIRINPKGEFRGSNGTINPTFTMTFRVRVK